MLPFSDVSGLKKIGVWGFSEMDGHKIEQEMDRVELEYQKLVLMLHPSLYLNFYKSDFKENRKVKEKKKHFKL